MQILHLLSNRKWTERSEPVADLVLSQKQNGHDVSFVCGRWTEPAMEQSSVAYQARQKGLDPIVLEMTKHFSWKAARKDIPRLRALVEQDCVEVVHAHMQNAHLLGVQAIRKLSTRPLVIRSSYAFEGPTKGFRANMLYGSRTDGVIVISETARNNTLNRFSIPTERICTIEPGIDIRRFDPQRAVDVQLDDLRIAESDFIVGMVTRIRNDRRVDLAVDAVAKLAPANPNLKLLIIGHGEGEEAMRARASELGISDRVTWGGYQRGDALVAAYRLMDILLYPVPGTDQSCRTVRESMASGVPVIAGKIDYLNELIDAGKTGYLVDLTADAVAEQIAAFLQQPDLLPTCSRHCLAASRTRFSLEHQAKQTTAFYDHISQLAR